MVQGNTTNIERPSISILCDPPFSWFLSNILLLPLETETPSVLVIGVLELHIGKVDCR